MLKKIVFSVVVFLALGLVQTAPGQIIVPLPVPSEIRGGKLGWSEREAMTISLSGVRGIYRRVAKDAAIRPLVLNLTSAVGTDQVGPFFPGSKALYFFTNSATTWKVDYTSLLLEKVLANGDSISFKLTADNVARQGIVNTHRHICPSLNGDREYVQLLIRQPAKSPYPEAYFTGIFEKKKIAPITPFGNSVVFEQAMPLRSSAVGLFVGPLFAHNDGTIVYHDWTTLGSGISTDDRQLIRYDPDNQSSKVLIKKTGMFFGDPVFWWTLHPDYQTFDLYVRIHTTVGGPEKLVRLDETGPLYILSTEQGVTTLGKPAGVSSIVGGRTMGFVAARYQPGKKGVTSWGNPELEVPDTVLFWDPLPTA